MKSTSRAVLWIDATILLLGGWRNNKDCTDFSIQNSINSISISSMGISNISSNSSSSSSSSSSGSSRSSGGSSSSSKRSWKTSSVGLSYKGRGVVGETMLLGGCETMFMELTPEDGMDAMYFKSIYGNHWACHTEGEEQMEGWCFKLNVRVSATGICPHFENFGLVYFHFNTSINMFLSEQYSNVYDMATSTRYSDSQPTESALLKANQLSCNRQNCSQQWNSKLTMLREGFLWEKR